MAPPKVRADYDALSQIARQFSQQRDNTRQTYQLLKRDMATLESGDWLGEGAKKFYAEMNDQVLPTLQRLVNALDSSAATTRTVSQTFQEAEDEAARILTVVGTPGLLAALGGAVGEAWRGMVDAVSKGMAALGAAADANLKKTVDDALKQPNVKFSDIKDAIEMATPAGREAIWKDKALMAQLKAKMSTEDYLDTLPALRVFEKGSEKHLSPDDADANIQKHLKEYVGDAVKDGRKISGRVSVVGADDWEVAGKARYGDQWDVKRDALNGFVDTKGRVWINKDAGNLGTMVHEGVHKYSKDAVINASQPLNEGVTEYFARDVIKDGDLKVNRTVYQQNYRTADALAKFVGEDKVAKAYFDGDLAGLKSAYIAKGKTEADWNKFLDHTKKKEWTQARDLLK